MAKSVLEKFFSQAFEAINKYKMDMETHVKEVGKRTHPIYGIRLETKDIDLAALAELNPRVKASMAYPGQRYSELLLEYAGELPKKIEGITSVHKLRSSFDPHSPIVVLLKNRPSKAEINHFEKKAKKEGFIVNEVRSRRTVSVGGMPFTDLRHVCVYSFNYDLVASIPVEHNALPVFDAEKGAMVCALLLE